jgi:hypothetical protein
MRLNFLFDMEFRYTEPIDMLFPSGGNEGQGFGGGIGTVEGDRLRGTFKWSNWPRIREDGVALPNLTGIIETDDGARILFKLDGYSLVDPSDKRRIVVGGATFLSDHENYNWLNKVYAVEEGAINLETAVVRARFHECIPDA